MEQVHPPLQDAGYSAGTDYTYPAPGDDARPDHQHQPGFASGGYALYQVDDDMPDEADLRDQAYNYEQPNSGGYDQNGAENDQQDHGYYVEQNSDIPDAGVSYHYYPEGSGITDTATVLHDSRKDGNISEWEHVEAAKDTSYDNISATRLRKPALSFGLGGNLLLNVGFDIAILPKHHLVVDSANGSRLNPLLGDEVEPTDQYLAELASRIRALGLESAVEDGLLRGSTAILHEALAAFVQCRGKRSERLTLSKKASHGCFETALMDILASYEASSSYSITTATSFSSEHLPGSAQERAALENFDRLLLLGDQDGAVSYAVRNGLWPQALIVANHVSAASYRRVAAEYASRHFNRSTASHFTLQLLSGRGVEAVRDHPALEHSWTTVLRCILANRPPNQLPTLRALGDRLWVDLKSIAAAHVCYIAAANDCLDPSERVMLVGGDHVNSLRGGFATPASIERTEIFLYGQSLNPTVCAAPRYAQALNDFQPFRLVQAMHLMEEGNPDLAKKWLGSLDTLAAQGLIALDGSVREQCEHFRARLFGLPIVVSFSSPPLHHQEAPGTSKAFSDRLMSAIGEGDEDEDAITQSFISKRPLTPPTFDVSIMSPAPNHQQQQSGSEGMDSPFAARKAKPEEATASANGDPFAKPVPNKIEEVTTESTGNPFAPRPPRPSQAVPESPFNAGRTGRSSMLPSQVAAINGDAKAPPSMPNPAAAPPMPPKPAPQVAPPSSPSKEDSKTEPSKSKPASSSGGNGWFSGDLRGWLVQKIIGVPKNATLAKTGDKLTARYDEQQKRWIFPGDSGDSGPTADAAPPIVKMDQPAAGKQPEAAGGGAASSATPQRPGGARSRYVVAT